MSRATRPVSEVHVRAEKLMQDYPTSTTARQCDKSSKFNYAGVSR
jgi:hypothetical protein